MRPTATPVRSYPKSVVLLGMLFLLVVIMELCPSTARAQIGATSSISGQITDQTGAVLPDATISLTDMATDSTRTVVSNETGRYVFSSVQPGTYRVSVAKPQFQTALVENQKVTVNVPLTLNFSLTVGATEQSVTVSGVEGAELQTQNATVGTTISGETVLLLPNVARDASSLVTYQAGVTTNGNVAGAQNDANTYMVDGANNNDDMAGGNNVYTPGFGGTSNGTVPTPAESIEEFKVNTNNQTADFYASAGGQIQLVTKRGTDRFHGSVYDFFQGSFLNANTFVNDHNHIAKPKTHQNRFGAAFGGPLTSRKLLGGKTYLYLNYEGRRLPQSVTFVRNVPSDLMRAGILDFLDAKGNPVYYNLNPYSVTVNGVTYPGTTLDPRGIGINPIVNTLWSKYMPHSNYKLAGDQINVVGYQGQILSPVADDTGTARLDHDFGNKHHFMSSYRIYKLRTFSTAQTDIGGFLPGNTLGTIVPSEVRPVEPSLWVMNLTSTFKPNLTNNFTWNYTRNWWEFGSASAPPQIPGIPAALEIGGESNNALIPVNVDTQDVRQRVWDGHDYYYKDDVAYLRGSHYLQFGGQFERVWDYHTRDDNGVATLDSLTYLIGSGVSSSPAINFTGYMPTVCSASTTTNCLPSSQQTTFQNDYAMVLGLVSQPQVMVTRTGSNLSLLPAGTGLSDEDTIRSYDVYFNDTWQMKPHFTLSYGLNYGIQMPPSEKDGKQVMLVDSAGNPLDVMNYFRQRDSAAAAGNFTSPAFNPEIGFENVGNTGRKYPFNPFYGGFGPHISAAWSPRFDNGWKARLFGNNATVIRGGYGRIYGRLNGVRLVLIPLLGVGFGQTLACQDPLMPSAAAGKNACAGPNGSTPGTAFRIGTDGNTAPLPTPTNTLPQPIFTGVGGQATAASQLQLSPQYRPSASDQFTLSLQRTLPRGLLLEAGYIGVKAHNLYTSINLDEVPYMSVVNGQSFAAAYANVEQAVRSGASVSAQPFIEGALAGSSYCAGFSSCTAALVSKQASNFAGQFVSNIWSAMSKNFNPTIFPAFNSATGTGGTMMGLDQLTAADMSMSIGWSNYNAGYISLQKRSDFGLTVNANFTYSHTLSTLASSTGQTGSGFSPSNPLDLRADYSDAAYDQRLHFNLTGLYKLPFRKAQQGFIGRVAGGWSVAPIFTWYTGVPIPVRGGSSQEFGQGFAQAKDSNAILTVGKSALPSQGVNFGVTGSSGVGTAGFGVNLFSNPAAVFAAYRPPILGLDTTGGGNGSLLRTPNYYNLDFTLAKDVVVRESVGVTFQAAVFNTFNHVNWTATTFSLQDPQHFGTLNPITAPRIIELGLRVHF